MTTALIGNLTVCIIFAAVAFSVIGALATVNWIWRKI